MVMEILNTCFIGHGLDGSKGFPQILLIRLIRVLFQILIENLHHHDLKC